MEAAMKQDIDKLAREYLGAVGTKDMRRVEALLAPDVTFVGPVLNLKGAGDVLAALRRIGAVHVRNDIKRVFVDGDEACVIYDFVTDTTAGALATIEWLRFDGGRIRSIDLYYDRLPWQAVMAVIAERAARPAASAVV